MRAVLRCKFLVFQRQTFEAAIENGTPIAEKGSVLLVTKPGSVVVSKFHGLILAAERGGPRVSPFWNRAQIETELLLLQSNTPDGVE